VSWIFYTAMTRERGGRTDAQVTWLIPTLYIVFLMLPIYWLVSMSFKTTNEILGGFTLFPQRLHAGELRQDLHRPDLVHGATSTRSSM
jgi:glycerol transport system permease protein